MPTYTPRPYVREPYEHNSRLADLILRSGEQRADAQRRSGESSAQMWSQVGHGINQTLGNFAQARQEAPIQRMREESAQLELAGRRRQLGQAQEADATKSAAQEAIASLSSGGNPSTVLANLKPEPRAMVQAWLAQSDEHRRQIGELKKKELQSSADLIRRLGGDPVMTEGLIKRASELYPEIAEAWPAVKADPARARSFIDALADMGKEPTKPEPFTLGSGQQRFGPDGKLLASVPEKVTPPAPFNLGPGQTRFGSDGKPIASMPAAPREPRAPGAKYWVVRNGKQIRISDEEYQPGDLPPAGSEKPSSGVQKRVLNFFNRARQADDDLEGLETTIQGKNLAGQVRFAVAPNFAQSQEGQAYTAAQRAFTEARLRKDSGAAIPDHEFANDRRTYFMQPGDSKETLEQKRRARAAILASLAFESGQALAEFIGSSDEAQAVMDGYKVRATKTDAAPTTPRASAPKGATGITVTAPDGQTFTFPNQAQADAFKKRAGIP